MTALDDYEALTTEKHLIAVVSQYELEAVADTAIESLKCCGNCANVNWIDHPHLCSHKPTTVGWNTDQVWPYDHCHFEVSRWKEYTWLT